GKSDIVQERPMIAQRIGTAIAPLIRRSRADRLRKQLLSAGYYTTSVETFLGYYLLSGLAVTLVILWFITTTGIGGLMLFLTVIGGGVLAWMTAPTLLSRRARLRLERMDREMPELVDLLLLGVEAGMGLPGATRVAAAHIDGPLGDEMRLLLRQQGLGASTLEALDGFQDRADTDAVRSFVRTVSQGERLGVSVGQMMRSLAEEMRKRRRAIAEEQAHRTPVKIIFPLVLLLLPAMLILIVTPAIVKGIETFSGG
ncbi:MAG: type II secretion system F family protein, partial [Solirubrobacteraceae bacterium]